MKKVIYSVLIIILFITINACAGYKPVFSSANLQFEISNYTLEGNKLLGNQIYSKLHKLSESQKNNQNQKSIDLLIKVIKDKKATAKNSSGKILEYKITLSTYVKVIDVQTDSNILNETFISSLTYKVQSLHSDTVDIENRSIEDIMNNTYQDLLIKLSEHI